MWLMGNTRLPATGGIKARVSTPQWTSLAGWAQSDLILLQYYVPPPSKIPNGGPAVIAVAA